MTTAAAAAATTTTTTTTTAAVGTTSPSGSRPLSSLQFSAEPIRRDHWKPDEAVLECEEPSCKKPFTLFDRRHHCRKCGGIFCAAHSSNTMGLNHDAQPEEKERKYRVCLACHQSGYGSPKTPPPMESKVVHQRLEHQLQSMENLIQTETTAIERLESLMSNPETDETERVNLQQQIDSKQELIRRYELIRTKVKEKIASGQSNTVRSVNRRSLPPNSAAYLQAQKEYREEDQKQAAPTKGEFRVIGMWEFHGETDTELSFAAGEVLEVMANENSPQQNPEWYYAFVIDRAGKRRSGFIPQSYVEKIDDHQANLRR